MLALFADTQSALATMSSCGVAPEAWFVCLFCCIYKAFSVLKVQPVVACVMQALVAMRVRTVLFACKFTVFVNPKP